jgi:hypothetical protein
VKDVLDLLAAGATREEILTDYPYLEGEDITAVLEFAARQNDHPVLRSRCLLSAGYEPAGRRFESCKAHRILTSSGLNLLSASSLFQQFLDQRRYLTNLTPSTIERLRQR